MSRIFMILAVMAMPFLLAACSTTNTASSSYSGKSLSKKKIKSSRKYRKSRSKKKVAYYKKRKSSSRKASKRRYSKRKSAKRSSKRRVAKRRTSKRSYRGRKARLRKLIARHAKANGVPVRLAMAVVQVESAYRVKARGAAGEIGLMQLMPRTARHIGYKGSFKKLYNPNTNLRYGMKYLGKAYRLGGRTSCGAVLKYNAGHGAKRMNPISRRYCKRVSRILRGRRA